MKAPVIIGCCVVAWYFLMGGGEGGGFSMPSMGRGASSFGGGNDSHYSTFGNAQRMSDYNDDRGDTRGHY